MNSLSQRKISKIKHCHRTYQVQPVTSGALSAYKHSKMSENRKNQSGCQSSINSAPPVPTAIDKEIANHSGSTVSIEARQDRLQAAKRMPTPTLSQMVEQLTWQNGQLRSEIDYHQRRHAASLYLLQKTKLIVQSLEQAIENFGSLDSELGTSSVKYGQWDTA